MFAIVDNPYVTSAVRPSGQGLSQFFDKKFSTFSTGAIVENLFYFLNGKKSKSGKGKFQIRFFTIARMLIFGM